MNNLKLYVTKKDYQVFSGPDWPSYDAYLAGIQARDPRVQEEIDAFTKLHVDQGIKFPINTATACQSKWTWSTIWLNELATSSCHRVQHYTLTLDNFDNFHNLPQKQHERKRMLRGEWPGNGCEYCRDIEMAGGWSDRQHNLDIRGLTPPELETDPTATAVTPRIIEIFAQNTCNLSCIYCNAALSSKIEQENKKFGNFNRHGVQIPIYNVPHDQTQLYFEKFIAWLKNNIQHLVRLHLLGGETFIQHDLMESVLDVIEQHPNPRLELCTFSNLNVPDKYWNLYIDRIMDLQARRHIRVFDLTASIDCWGPEQEYVRSGLDLDKFEQRFAWASEQDPEKFRLNVNQTVTAMTMRTMPDLIRKINYYGKNRHIGHYFQFYTGTHMFQHPKNYAYTQWQDTMQEIFSTMSRREESLEAIDRMQGMDTFLKQFQTHNYSEITKLKVYLDELDRRRGTDWRSLFSYLDINE